MVGSLALGANMGPFLATALRHRLFASTFQIVSPANGPPLIILLLVFLELCWTQGFCLIRLFPISAHLSPSLRGTGFSFFGGAGAVVDEEAL